jgi:protein-tyrosine-phosphatase/DNA-binding transcriptional ArsR family regulator
VSDSDAEGSNVPGFLRLAGHPVRWGLLSALARSDLRVNELTGMVGQPQNLVSYHLGQLRTGQLVSTRRSAADGRDTYYSLDLSRCGELLAATGGALHPGLRLTAPEMPVDSRSGHRLIRILFLCTGNSARSQIAEGFLRHLTDGRAQAFSAGSHPKSLHPAAIAVMAEYGIDISGQRAKHVDDVSRRRISHVVTLCDRVREICPEFRGGTEYLHWSMPDPAQDADGYPAFQRTAAELHTRVGFLVHRLSSTPALEVT